MTSLAEKTEHNQITFAKGFIMDLFFFLNFVIIYTPHHSDIPWTNLQRKMNEVY